MKYTYQKGLVVPYAQKYSKQLTVAVAAMFVATFAATTLHVGAASVPVNGCTFLQTGSKWKLVANCTSIAQINVPSGTRLDGNDKTIKAGFDFTDNSNNAVLGIIDASNVRVKDLTVDGNGRIKLHGINVYQSTNVKLDEVTTKNNTKNGLVVNGSDVMVKDLTTSGNAWGGVDVDQGGGVTMPSILTIKGKSRHAEMVHVYVDDMTKLVQVNDVRNQYTFVNPAGGPLFDRLYTLKPVLDSHHDDDDHDD